jgi:hypothetical protein
MRPKISKQVQRLMENLINTVELAEEAPDFIAHAVQDLFDEYADERLEAAAHAIEKIDGGSAAAKVRKLIRNSPRKHIAEELGKQFHIRSK